ncbi:hypothetical protein IMAU10031_02073 [Lactobacillus helveticus]|nr:hypothetical protein [Lactobacillus helveticus]
MLSLQDAATSDFTANCRFVTANFSSNSGTGGYAWNQAEIVFVLVVHYLIDDSV